MPPFFLTAGTKGTIADLKLSAVKTFIPVSLKVLKQHTALEGHRKSVVNVCLIYPFYLQNIYKQPQRQEEGSHQGINFVINVRTSDTCLNL